MILNHINQVDTIGIDNENGKVILSIIDELNWQDEKNHLQLLQAKINTYLRFIESDEIYSSYPDAKGRNFEIKIFFAYSIPEICISFLNTSLNIINESGFNLIWETI